jgi:FMN phosphatase YigB (HAD superfamily)
MPEIHHIFLDDGGVLNDNSLRAPQWQRLVGEFFVPRLGGTPEAWAEANRSTFEVAWGRMLERIETFDLKTDSYSEICRLYDLDWLGLMCEGMGIEPLPEEQAVLLAREVDAYIMPRVRAAYPGAVESVKLLSKAYALYTASGGASYELSYTFSGLGIEGFFHRLYGPDLVNCPKASPEYYRRIFADADVDPAEALVLDDKRLCLSWAQEAGAGAVIRVGAGPQTDGVAVIASLAELPALLE